MSEAILSFARKLDALRAEMAREKLDGFILPRVDIYQGEFVAPHAERLAWLTGFTGSAGTAVILKDKAVILTDGRYTIQLAQQADKALYQLGDSTKEPASKWIAAHGESGAVIGYDPWLVTPRQLEAMEGNLKEKKIKLKPCENLIDRVWQDRPPPPLEQAEIFPEKIAGIAAAAKKEQVARALQETGMLAAVINLPDSLAWLLNVRGRDIESTPVVLSLGILYADGRVKWFVDERKITPAIKRHLGNAVEIIGPAQIENHIDLLIVEAKKTDSPVALDFTNAPVFFKQRLEAGGAKVADRKDPCILPKAMKTAPEQQAIKKAHITDGVAMVKFLSWLESEAPQGALDEFSVGEKLEVFRRESEHYKGPSFATIAGYNANGAIVHYRAEKNTAAKIIPPGLLLVDSGGQYHYGTTDITRTVAIGEAAGEETRRNFTLVLKGHIAVARAKFAPGTTGVQIDALARAPLKEQGLDYAHGTGHGVGCYLSVHEEAANISPRGTDALRPGMLLSNEPGYYKEGAYGIRIENLVLVTEENDGLGFETVTLAPIDRRLVMPEALSQEERQWLDDYHARVYKMLAPLLDEKLKGWLAAACRPV